CADLDDLEDRLPRLRDALKRSPNVWALFKSPSGNGLKVIFRVVPDASSHYGSFLAVQSYMKKVHDVSVDEKCSDVGRLCLLSHDPEVYLKEDAIELPPIQRAAANQKEYAALTA